MLQLKNITKKFGKAHALQGINLNLEKGKITALIGPSGCGKSTLIRVMIGLIAPDKGEVSFHGECLAPQTIRAVRQRMGYVIQEGGLFPHLTAKDNITLMAKYLGWKKPRVDERVRILAELTHIEPAQLKRYPVQLSGGQRQRIALMRALMLEPELLLLDEPMGALDPMIRASLQEDLKQIFQKLKQTVVIVTHDIGEAGFFADNIVLMKGGTIVQQDTLVNLVKSPKDAFVTQFINAQRSPLENIH